MELIEIEYNFFVNTFYFRVTVFSAENLPITVCKTENAEEIYAELLGSELFVVPTGQERRLKKWPELISSKDLNVVGIDSRTACADVVLSSAGESQKKYINPVFNPYFHFRLGYHNRKSR